MEGKTARGASSPAKPALHMPEPLSTTRAATSILKAANRIRAAMEPSFPKNPNEKCLACFIRLGAGRGARISRAAIHIPSRLSGPLDVQVVYFPASHIYTPPVASVSHIPVRVGLSRRVANY
ncbi:hypothetical protein E2C01_055475 [Portunus trituberculatus]|uniref:Uncharacterized protein n=1 Tax=Portunus trituberculatus TaxID=210409 RepID=A0A5B7GRA4_PORTR|nr:hypothetical protein [Portunus trituberculatus]